jgi:ribosomal protein S18 acetylase RimI-like enzyme
MLKRNVIELSCEEPDENQFQEAVRVIDEGLTSFNAAQRPDPNAGPLVIVTRNDQGVIVGGVRGRVAYGWLRIDMIWVSESMRGKGYGSTLLLAAERAALDRGCHSVHLDTFEFQAPEFYRAHGYEVFGELEDYPEGEKHLYFKKRISPTSARA